jgi:hypothetical protein
MIRHFAETQQLEESHSNVLVEGTQPIPGMFIEMLHHTLDRVTKLTTPLRKTLQLQCETGRLLPWYNSDELVPVADLYIHLTGNPLGTSQSCEAYIDRYRKTLDAAVLHDLYRYQSVQYRDGSPRLCSGMYLFLNRLQKLMRTERVYKSYLRRHQVQNHSQMAQICRSRPHPEFSMIEPTSLAPSNERTMREILEILLEGDDDITARAVARLHPIIKTASSITRSGPRSALLAEYQHRQKEYRLWRDRVGKKSGVRVAATIADKDIRIADLESQVALLTASHLAILRAVGEFGGFGKWAAFYEQFREARQQLDRLGATPKLVAGGSGAVSVTK